MMLGLLANVKNLREAFEHNNGMFDNPVNLFVAVISVPHMVISYLGSFFVEKVYYFVVDVCIHSFKTFELTSTRNSFLPFLISYCVLMPITFYYAKEALRSKYEKALIERYQKEKDKLKINWKNLDENFDHRALKSSTK